MDTAGAKPAKSGQRDGVNVQVLLRCRPPNQQEIIDRAPQVIQCNEVLREVTLFQNSAGKQVFSPQTGQEKLFSTAIVPIVDEVLDGFNCTIFAYGQTGTGKTYTMEGGPRNSSDGSNLSAEAGVIPRAIKYIFDTIESSNSDSSVKVTFLELYNEELTDLLALTDDKDARRLRLLEDRSGVVVQGLEEAIVKNAAEIYQVLDRGTAKRKTAETLLNKRSSRSHSVFTITIHMREQGPEGDDVIKIGKLNLVDLAGSENISRSGAKDDRAREAGSINQSLLTLGRVITALVEHSGHVPYRDSKLTRLLRDSLGGRTKTCIIATIAPSNHCQEETISTLDYAHRAKNIRNRPEVNQKISKTTLIKELSAEIEKLKTDLVASREKNGVYLTVDSYNCSELERAQLRLRVQSLEAESEQLAEETRVKLEKKEAEHAAYASQLQQEIQRTQSELHAMQKQLNDAKGHIEEQGLLLTVHHRSAITVARHAEGLTKELEGASADLELLFSKLDEMSQLQNGDRLVLKTVAEYAATKLAFLDSAVQSIAKEQHQRSIEVHQMITAEQQRKDEELAQLRLELQQLYNNTTGLLATSSQQLASIAGQVVSEYTSVISNHKALSQDSIEMADQACKAGADTISALQQSLHASTERLQALSDYHHATAENTLRGTEHFISKLVSKLATTYDQTAAAHEQSSSHLVESLSSLQTFKNQFDRSIADQQEQVLQQVASLLEGFAKQGQDLVKAAVDGIGTQLAQQHTAVADTTRSIGAELKALQDDAQGLYKHLEDSTRVQCDGVAQHIGNTTAALEACSTTAIGLNSQLETCHNTVQQHVRQQHEDMQKAAAASCSSVDKASKKMQDELLDECKVMESSFTSFNGHLGSAHSTDLLSMNAVSESTAASAEAVLGFASTHQEHVQSVSQHISTEVHHQLQQVAGMAVPSMRISDVPPVSRIQAMMCPPADVILRYYRQQRKAIAQTGGDPRSAADLVTPGKFAAMHQAHYPKQPGVLPSSPAAENMRPAGCENSDDPLTPVAHKATKMPSKIPGLGVNPSLGNCTPRSKALADLTNH